MCKGPSTELSTWNRQSNLLSFLLSPRDSVPRTHPVWLSQPLLSGPAPRDPSGALWPGGVGLGRSQLAGSECSQPALSHRTSCRFCAPGGRLGGGLFPVCRRSPGTAELEGDCGEKPGVWNNTTGLEVRGCLITWKAARPNRHLAVQGPGEPPFGGLAAGPHPLTPE